MGGGTVGQCCRWRCGDDLLGRGAAGGRRRKRGVHAFYEDRLLNAVNFFKKNIEQNLQ